MAKSLAPMPGSSPDSAEAVNASAAPSKNTTGIPRKNSAHADPAIQPVGIRTYAPRERNGAAYGVSVGFEAHTAPEAGATLANGRVSQPVVNRSAPNFAIGTHDHN